MDTNEVFEHYRKHFNTPIPKDPKFLEGMYLIRRRHANPQPTAGEITKAAVSRQQVQVRGLSDNKGTEWVAWAALLNDAILFHSSGDMWACFSALSRNAKAAAKAEA
jgi:hypothetical protein